MGFTGTFVLSAPNDADQLRWLGDYDDRQELLRPWTALTFDDEDLFAGYEDVLTRIVRETGRSALIALTLDSDFLGVVGLSPSGQTWSGVVDAEAASYHREEAIEEGYAFVVPEFSPPEVAVPHSLRWAADAGLSPNEVAVRRVFGSEGWTRPAHEYWGELIRALGVQ